MSNTNRIPISRTFAALAMETADFISSAQSEPEADLELVAATVEDVLIGVARDSPSGELIDASGNLNRAVSESLSRVFGWPSENKCIELLVSDLKQAFRSKEVLRFGWATFRLVESGAVTWISHPLSHDSGLEPPTERVSVELPDHQKGPTKPTTGAVPDASATEPRGADTKPYTLPTEVVRQLKDVYQKILTMADQAPLDTELDIPNNEAANWFHHIIETTALRYPHRYQMFFEGLSSWFEYRRRADPPDPTTFYQLPERVLFELLVRIVHSPSEKWVWSELLDPSEQYVRPAFTLSLVGDALYRHALENNDWATLEFMVHYAVHPDNPETISES